MKSEKAQAQQPSSTDSAFPVVTPSVWHLTVAYDGTAYHGWQKQPSQITLQSVLEHRLRLMFHHPELEISGTSRTDAGVHALDQQISFPDPGTRPLTPERLCFSLNRWLPPDLRVLQVWLQPPEFHARFSARGKAYTYVVTGAEPVSPFIVRYAWHYRRPLRLDLLQQEAQLFVGTHDFASFGNNPRREVLSTVRTIYRLEVVEAGGLIYFNVVGDGFLYKMVRSLVGHLLQVGCGRLPAGRALEVLAAQDRSAAGETAPPHGLFLAKVFYEDGAWRDYRPVLPPFAGLAPESRLAEFAGVIS